MTSAINENLRKILDIINERFDNDLPDDKKGKLTENDWLSINNITAQTYKQINELSASSPERRVEQVERQDTPSDIFRRTPWEIKQRWIDSVHSYFQTYASKISPSTIKCWTSQMDFGVEGHLRDGTNIVDIFSHFFSQPETEVPLDIAEHIIRSFTHDLFFHKLDYIYHRKFEIYRYNHRAFGSSTDGTFGSSTEPSVLSSLLQEDMKRTENQEKNQRKSRRQGWRPKKVKVRILEDTKILAEATLNTHLRNLAYLSKYLYGTAMRKLGEMMFVNEPRDNSLQPMYQLMTIDEETPTTDPFWGQSLYDITICKSQRPRKYCMSLGGNLVMDFTFEENIL